jgi:type IV secretory pathway ATPase VirB11/archaellum biosynthesis ATPase
MSNAAARWKDERRVPRQRPPDADHRPHRLEGRPPRRRSLPDGRRPLPDGSRVNAIIPPLALDGAAVSIRRFGSNPLKLEDLLNYKAFTPEMVMLLEGAIKARLNIIISGGTGSGKTTLLNTLSSFIPNDDRIVTIEDAAELQLQQEHVVRLETRPPNIEGKGRSPPPTWCATPCVCGPSGSSSANAADRKRSTCCRP